MVSKWRTLPFNEAVQLNPAVRLRKGNTYPFVDMASIDPNVKYVSAAENREFQSGGSRFLPKDTLMARITPSLENGKIAQFNPKVIEANSPAHGSTEFIVIRGRHELSDTDFAYYLTRWDEVRDYAVSQMSGTSGRQRVPTDCFGHLEITLPPLPEQRAIAHILGTLDDKIELNRRMKETLEAMARALFKSWFVDFDPVRAKMAGCDTGLPPHIADLFPDRLVPSEVGEIPEGWAARPLDEIAQFRNGLALQKHRPQEGEDWLPVVKIKQLNAGRADGKEKASASIRPEFIIDDGDVIFSWSGTLLVKVWCGGCAALNQHLFKVTSGRYPKWFYQQILLSHLSFFQAIAAGKATTMGHIRRHHLNEALCVVPDTIFLRKADGIMSSILDKCVVLGIQSRSLADIRDTLLPKLLSGELQVRDAEVILEKVL